MPTISMFYGIIIRLFYFDSKKHHEPHIHAEYQEQSAIISITGGQVIEGTLPQNKLRLVLAWIEIHREELLANWKLALEGQPVFKIEGLK